MLNKGQKIENDSIPGDEEIEELFSKGKIIIRVHYKFEIFLKYEAHHTNHFFYCLSNSTIIHFIVLATMDLPPDKSKVLWNYDRDRKWEIIRDQKKVQAKQEPKYYLSRMRSYMDPKASRLSKRRRHVDTSTSSTQVLRDLEISLRTNSIEWVRDFLSEKNNGLNTLIDYLTFRLLMLQHDLIEKKLDKAHKKSTTQTSTSIAIDQDSLVKPENNNLLNNSSCELTIGSQNGSRPNSLLTSLLTSHANGHLDTLRTHQQQANQIPRHQSPKSSTLSSSSSSSSSTTTFSSKSNHLSSNELSSSSEFKQKKSLSSLINTALNNSLLIYNTNTKLSQEMSSRLDEAANQLTGNNLQQLTTANQQLSSTLQLFPKNHSQKMNLGSVADDIHVCIMSLRSIMNNKKGFNMVMEHPQAINCLALSLNHTSVRTKTLVLELLAAICLVKGGHELIIAAFNNFKLACHERLRFETLIHYLKNQEKFNVDFMVSCLQFINIIVHSVDDMNYRTHLQYEFTNLALDEYLDKLKQNESEELQVQIQTYLDNRIDVSALAEEAEAKNSALEQVQQLVEKLSIANELQTNIQLNYQAVEFRLQEANQQKEELIKENKNYQEQIARLKKALEQQNLEAKVRQETMKSVSKNRSDHLDQGKQAGSTSFANTNNPNDQSTTIVLTASAKSSPSAALIPTPPPPPPPPITHRLEVKATPAPPPPPPPPPPSTSMMPPLSASSSAHKKGLAPQPPAMPPSNQLDQQPQTKTTRMLQNLVKNDLPSNTTSNANNCDMMTLKKTFSTQYKLPTFNWLTLKPNQVRGTIFNEFHDEDKIIKSINFQDFEEQFKLGRKIDSTKRTENQQQQQSDNSSSKNGATNVDASSQANDNTISQQKRFKQPEKISFMEHNRLRNMAISLRKLSVPTNLLVTSINRLDIDQLSLDSIEILMRMVPTAQEVKAYQEFEAQGKSLDSLTEEDKFLSQISKVERLEQKIKIMFYMKNLEITQGTNSISSSYSLSSSITDSGDLLASTKAKIEMVETAAKSLRSSEGIRILLEYILVFGNYLNSSSRSLASAPAYGFKLQALDMVTEAKSTQDKNRNLLHFVVDTILKNLNSKEKAKLSTINPNDSESHKQPNNRAVGGKRISPLGAFDAESIKMPYDFDTLIVELEQAANVSLETLITEVKEFERGIELCIKELHVRCVAAEALEKSTNSIPEQQNEQALPAKQIEDEAIRRLQKFIKSRSCDIIEIKEVAQRAQKEFNECAQYFGENPRTIESSSLFAIFLRHLKNFKQCQADNKMVEKRKFDDELRKQIQQQQVLRAKKKLEVSNNQEQSQVVMNNNPPIDMKQNRLLHQDEVSHGTLDILITGLKVEPYRRADGMRKSIRRMERRANGEE